MLSEFDLIDRFFLQRARSAPSHGRAAHLGIGDDCALLPGRPGADYAVSTDMLVAGRHFLVDVDPRKLGHKSLAVNLSDLAAMGATPAAFTLSLALPNSDAAWLEPFSAGLFALANRFDCELVGGDTTAGPLTISITIFGEVPTGQALRRDAAKIGDDIWISGRLGDARLALGLMRNDWPASSALAASESESTLAAVRCAMEMPEPRVALGIALRGVAHAAIDISDGLAGDLGHILSRSGVAAVIDADALPRSSYLARQPLPIQRACTAAGGDDYELCITAPVGARDRLAEIAAHCGVALTRVGKIVARQDVPHDPAPASASACVSTHTPTHTPEHSSGHRGSDFDTGSASRLVAPSLIRWTDGAGAPLDLSLRGFDHFNAD